MWRSLFYAVGIALFVSGLQGLVVDHVLVPKNTKLQKLIRKILSDDNSAVQKNVAVQPAVATNSNLQAPLYGQTGTGSQPYGGVNTGSRFGPSRFSGVAYGTGYGGGRVNSPGQNAPGFGGLQNQNQGNAQLAGFRSNGPSASAAPQNPVALQKFVVREWMPWSLLASGAIIFLYTHTIHRRRNHE